jgi:hypothetical protein
MEELIVDWDLTNLIMLHGKFTWTNKCFRPSHIASHLDRLIFHIIFLSAKSSLKSYILPSLISDHKPIYIHIHLLPNFVPLPFLFLSLWLDLSNVEWLVVVSCKTWIPSNPIFILVKHDIKCSTKTYFIPPYLVIEGLKGKLKSL